MLAMTTSTHPVPHPAPTSSDLQRLRNLERAALRSGDKRTLLRCRRFCQRTLFEYNWLDRCHTDKCDCGHLVMPEDTAVADLYGRYVELALMERGTSAGAYPTLLGEETGQRGSTVSSIHGSRRNTAGDTTLKRGDLDRRLRAFFEDDEIRTACGRHEIELADLAPVAVLDDFRQGVSEKDDFCGWALEHCDIDTVHEDHAWRLYRHYEVWAKRAGVRCISKQQFGRFLRDGITTDPSDPGSQRHAFWSNQDGHGRTVWHGLRVRALVCATG